MIAEMEKDNLTELLTKFEDGVKPNMDLSAVTLYKDFISAALDASSYADTSTELIQMVQGEFLQGSYNFENY